MDANTLLEQIYLKAHNQELIQQLDLPEKIKTYINIIVNNEETMKGVFTCLVSSLTYKTLYPNQDVRYHKTDLPGGYSGRSFDTKYVTPFLKIHKFAGAMKESGWLTRSIEQDAPFTKTFPGKIQKHEVKEAFLEIFDYISLN